MGPSLAGPLLPLLAAGPLLVGISACASPRADRIDSPGDPALASLPPPADADADPDPEAAVRAVRQGDYRGARAILARLIVDGNLAEVQRLVDGDQALDALVLLDEALELAPGQPDLLYRRGQVAYTAAARHPQPGLLYGDALEHFLDARRSGAPIEALFDASRAARRVPNPERALELARQGARDLVGMESPPPIDPPPERTLAEASFDVYRARRAAEQDAGEYFAETEDALQRLLGRTPEDNWPRVQLANLYQWEGRVEQAIDQLRMALEVDPEDGALHERLMGLMPEELGYPALVEYCRDFFVRHPTPRSMRNLGVALFYGALARYDEGDYDVPALREAEGWFKRAREADPAWETDCLGFEVVTRDAIGFCHFKAGELSAAKEAFLSMEDLFEGGMAWSLPGRLYDGVAGLGFVIGKLLENSTSPEFLDGVVEAAAIADFLHAYRPEDATHANNAGFANREAAVLYEVRSQFVQRDAQNAEERDERERLEREAGRLRARAQELMEKSWAAYQVSARLAPDNVRFVNDAGLVMVYYLRDDPEAAERYFLSAIEQGSAQLADESFAEDERDLLVEAWGDAYQNMAILELTLRGNPAKAKEWLLKSLEIGPPSRERLRPLVDVCDRMLAGESVDLAQTLAGGLVWFHNPGRK